MKTKHWLFGYAALFAVAALTLAGCSGESIKQAEGDDFSNFKLVVRTGGKPGMTSNGETRALKTGWADGDKIAVFFDGTSANSMVVVYKAVTEEWVREPATITSLSASGRAQAFHAGSFDFAAGGFTNIEGDLLYDDAGSYAWDPDSQTLTVTLVMERGLTTAVKMDTGEADTQRSMKWRLAGEGLSVQTEKELAAGLFESAVDFREALATLFKPSNAPDVAAIPDEIFTKDNIAVFHVINEGAASGTTFEVYDADAPEAIYTRTYENALTPGLSVKIWGPESGETAEADEWSPITTGPVVFPYNLHTEFKGDVLGEGTSQFHVRLTTFAKGSGEAGHKTIIKFCSTAVTAPPTTRYIDMPAGEYTLSANPEAGTITTAILITYDESREVVEAPVITGATAVVSKEGDNYTIIFDFALEGGETFSGTYTGPLQFRNPDFLEHFASDDPDGEGSIYYAINYPDNPDDRRAVQLHEIHSRHHSGRRHVPYQQRFLGGHGLRDPSRKRRRRLVALPRSVQGREGRLHRQRAGRLRADLLRS
jgi:hypothetical protein